MNRKERRLVIPPSSVPTRPLPETICFSMQQQRERITEPLGNPNPVNNEHPNPEPLKIAIPLVKGKDTYIGKYAYVSKEDEDLAKNYIWHLDKHGYAMYQRRINGRRHTFFLHREIAERIAKTEGRKLT